MNDARNDRGRRASPAVPSKRRRLLEAERGEDVVVAWTNRDHGHVARSGNWSRTVGRTANVDQQRRVNGRGRCYLRQHQRRQRSCAAVAVLAVVLWPGGGVVLPLHQHARIDVDRFAGRGGESGGRDRHRAHHARVPARETERPTSGVPGHTCSEVSTERRTEARRIGCPNGDGAPRAVHCTSFKRRPAGCDRDAILATRRVEVVSSCPDRRDARMRVLPELLHGGVYRRVPPTIIRANVEGCNQMRSAP